jgi:hypothetical protein
MALRIKVQRHYTTQTPVTVRLRTGDANDPRSNLSVVHVAHVHYCSHYALHPYQPFCRAETSLDSLEATEKTRQ